MQGTEENKLQNKNLSILNDNFLNPFKKNSMLWKIKIAQINSTEGLEVKLREEMDNRRENPPNQRISLSVQHITTGVLERTMGKGGV